MTAVNHCQECGNHTSGHPTAVFCSTLCRKAFSNRRMIRGAEIYDLFRALRRQRSDAKRLNIWTEICRLELKWQIEDEAERPGRRSYMPPEKALANLFDKGSLSRGDVLASDYRVGR